MAPSTLPMFGPPDGVTVLNPGDIKVKQLIPQLKSNSAALESGRAVALARRFFSVTATNTGAINQFLQVFDASVAPADASVPLVSIPISSGQVQFYDVALGLPMINGAYVCVSTTQATKTLGAADTLFVVVYSEQLPIA